MAIKSLNSVAGFSVGETPANIILANGDITTNNFTTTGISNLNSISNVAISGGTDGQVIKTDGYGNLSFVTIDTWQIQNGSSNVQVLANSNVTVSIAGNANVATFSTAGLDVNGYVTVQGNVVANGNVSANNYLVTPGSANLIIAPGGPLTRFYSNVNPYSDGGYDLGNGLARWNNVFAYYSNIDGNLDVSANAAVGGLLTDNLYYANGTPWDLQQAAGSGTQIQYNDGSNNFGASANFTYDDSTQVFTVQGTANITGNLTSGNANLGNSATANNFSTNGTGGDVTLTGGNVTGANVVIANSFTSNGGTVDFATNNPNVQLGNVGNVHIGGGSDGQVLQTDGLGNLIWSSTANISEIHNGNSNITIPDVNGNVYVNANAGTDQQWNFGTDGTLYFPLVNSQTSIQQQRYGMGNLVGYNDGGWVLGEYNGTSYGTEGIRISPGIEGNVEVILPSDANAATNPLQLNNYAAGNVQINSNAQSWTFGADGEFYLPTGGRIGATKGGTMLDGGNGNTTSLTSFYSNGFYSACFTAYADGNAYITTYPGSGSTSWIFGVDGNLTGPATGTANLGNLVTANNFSTNGAGGDLTLSGGNVQGANVVIANSFTSNGGVVDFSTNNANVQLGDVGNLHILGGSTGYVLQTDGSGNLSWTGTASVTEIFNGNSNVTIPNADGNVYINANAGTDQQWVFDTDGNTSFPAIGIANLGNLVTANFANFANDVVVQGNIANANNITVTNNITSDTANVTGNLTSGNANLGNLVTVNYGNFANDLVVQGNIANANNISVTNNITSGSANVTNDLDVGGNIVTGTGSGGNISGVNYLFANVVTATGNITGGNIIAVGNGTFGNVISNAIFGTELKLYSTGNLILAPTGNISANSSYINNVLNPVEAHDAATKLYVDNSVAAGINIHDSVVDDSDDNLDATYADGGTTNTWTTITSNEILDAGVTHGLNINDIIVFNSTTNGITLGTPYFVASIPSPTSITITSSLDGEPITTLVDGTSLSITSLANSGVGATLTSIANGPLIQEGYTFQLNDRILVVGQTNQTENGTYYVSQVGVVDPGGSPWILTRATDADTYIPNSSQGLDQGAYFLVTGGSDAGEAYVCNTSGTIVFGTTNITFAQFSLVSPYTAGTGLSLAANLQFSISNTLVTAGSYGDGDNVPSYTINPQGQLTLSANVPITSNAANLTGTTLSTSIVNSSLTSTGTLATLSVAGNITTSGNIVTTGAQGNIQGANTIFADSFVSNGGLVDFNTNNANVQLGSNSNVHLYGGSSGQVLQTDGSGNLNWYSISATSIQNGNSNVTIPNVDGNVYINANSGTDQQWNFGTDGNTSFPSAGTANLGNLVTANNATISTAIVLGNTSVQWDTITTASVSANQTIASFSVVDITGVEFLVKGIDSTGNKYSVATVQAVTDGTDVDYSTYGTVNLGGFTGSLAVNVVGGYIRLQVTPASSNSTIWTTQYRLI